MNICFVTEGTVNSVWQEKMQEVLGQDLIVFGFNGLGLVSYKKELGGETEYFHDLARFSKQISSVVISGCDTDTYGVFRHSAVIADKGKILGVTDMVNNVTEGEYSSGGSYRVYETSAGKIGIIISEDLFYTESTKILTLCDADVIICIFKKLEGTIAQTVLRSNAFCNGVTMGLCSKNYAVVSDTKGQVVLSGGGEIIKTEVGLDKEYHSVIYKRRGAVKE